jgi:N-glycosylase/DNA lyase
MRLGPVPAGFDLARVVMSHGWCQLAPTAFDERRRVLHRTLLLPDAGPLTVSVRESRGGLEASWGRVEGSCDDRIAVKAQLRRMLAVDVDLTELYARCAALPSLAWVPASGLGRLLRSPTVFEDLAKTLATTNCSWALTKLMCRRLVDSLGAEGPAGERAFPTPEAVRAAGEAHFTEVVRAGYRARAFVELAERYDTLGVERWEDPAVPDEQVLKEVKALRGFGPYAAEGMLGLLGRPRGLAIDSWVRAKLPRLLGRDAMTDAEIAEHFAPLGRWAGLGLWLELTRDWFGIASTP